MNGTNANPGNPGMRQNGLWPQPPIADGLHSAEAGLPERISLLLQKSVTPGSFTFPAPAHARDPAREMIRPQPTLEEIEKRLGTAYELPGDFEQVRELAHALGNLAQKSRLANYLAEKKTTAPATPTKEIKGGRPPDFDLDDTIQWVGRTI